MKRGFYFEIKGCTKLNIPRIVLQPFSLVPQCDQYKYFQCRKMNALAQEIEGFSTARLRKQSTRVTTVTGKKLVETRSGDDFHVTRDTERESDAACGFVQDLNLDLQVGIIRPFLLLCAFLSSLSKLTQPHCFGKIMLIHCTMVIIITRFMDSKVSVSK